VDPADDLTGADRAVPPGGVRVAPLPISWSEPLVARLRDLVVGEPGVAAAFLYLRDVGDGARPAVGLLAGPDRARTDAHLVAAVERAVGTVWDGPPAVVAVAPEVLPALLAVSPPLGAGGRLEVETAAAVAAPGTETTLAVAATFAFVTLVVPVLDGPPEGRSIRHRDRLHLPAAQPAGAEGRPAVGAFSSELAVAHVAPAEPGVALVPGGVLARAVEDGADLVVDPGLPWSAVVPTGLVRRLAEAVQGGNAGSRAPVR